MNITQVPVSLQFRHKYTTQVINLFHGDAGFKAAHMAFNQPSTFFIFFFLRVVSIASFVQTCHQHIMQTICLRPSDSLLEEGACPIQDGLSMPGPENGSWHATRGLPGHCAIFLN